MTEQPLPYLAVEQPTADLSIDLLPVNGGCLSLNTTAAHIIDVLREGLPDLTAGDLVRIADLYHAALEILRDKDGDT